MGGKHGQENYSVTAYARACHAPSSTVRLPGELTGSGCGSAPYGPARGGGPIRFTPGASLACAWWSSGGSPALRLARRPAAEIRRRPIAVAIAATAERCGSLHDTSDTEVVYSTTSRTLASAVSARGTRARCAETSRGFCAGHPREVRRDLPGLLRGAPARGAGRPSAACLGP